MRITHKPGDAMEVDWGEATIYMNGTKTTVNLFCAKMCYSCAPFVIAYWRQNLESFLDALIRTFKYFGGVTRNVVFDNARVAVKSSFGAHASAQDDYSQLAAHYGFQPIFCNPASGNEKGLVLRLAQMFISTNLQYGSGIHWHKWLKYSLAHGSNIY